MKIQHKSHMAICFPSFVETKQYVFFSLANFVEFRQIERTLLASKYDFMYLKEEVFTIHLNDNLQTEKKVIIIEWLTN